MLRTYMNSGKRAAAILTIAAMSFLVAAPIAHADDHRGRCQHRIEKAEARYDDAVRHHGEHSRQAEDRRRDLNAQREQCWNEFHEYWDGHAHQWHNQHDWDIVISH